ncbi:kinesin-like protein KIF26A isoform X3 [Triplophysa rosa]|uniref:kinesin-like protein KIF26A isoform X3 n=1 Tax=Triplophysa rosa TaxID=992332 RepID=UPI0025461DF3|nr:kinesin-like protein KIF26A isoform X3 [Triplophysa rosa]
MDLTNGDSHEDVQIRRSTVESCSSGESSFSLELSPRKRLSVEEERCASRPPPEGAGAVSVSESDRQETRADLCKQCQMTIVELRRQALALADPSSLKDPGFASFIIDQLKVPDWPVKSGHEDTRCQVCATPAQLLRQQALQTLEELYSGSDMASLPPSTYPGHPTRLTTHSLVTVSSRTAKSRIPHPEHSILPVGDRRREIGWTQNPTSSIAALKPGVQVTVGGRPLTGAISSVTIQAQQYLEGMWSISRVNNFLPQPCPTQSLMGQAEQSEWSTDTSVSRVSLTPSSPVQFGQDVPPSAHQPSSAAASFFIKAAQKLNLSSKRKKQQPPLVYPQEPSIYPTNFSAVLQFSPPPAPPCLLRAGSKAKENPGMGKVKVMMRICPTLGVLDSSMSFLKVDTRKKQLTLHDPSLNTQPISTHRRAALPAPKMFAFDAVFPQDASQAEVCSGTVAEVIQSVVNGADGCIFCFGHVKVGKTYTMIGTDSSTQSIGIAPCAISWLFKLINERKEKTGTRFSVRVSAVEIYGKDESLQDLLSDVPTGSMQDGQSPGVYLREDPICGTQLQNQSELRAPTAEKAALFLDAAIAARSTNRPDADEDDRRNSHMLFTLHVYQYRMEKSGKGGMSGGRSRLHLIDLGSCEKVLSKSRDGGGGLCLSLTALGNVILALANGAKHVPYRDSKLTMLLRDSLGNINCRTTMIAHISDSPVNYAESLTTIQLASRIHRMRKKKSKYASSSSGGDSSCDEGRIRRPPHLRPFHPRTVALDPDLPPFLSDPDYSSSSEQSCDTVIYIGPGGAAISDRELSDNEGPPAFIPIIPSLNRKQRGKEGPVDHDHFKCNTFAELQERLECIDGSEEPTAFVGESGGNSASPKMERDASKFKEDSSSVPVSPMAPTKACSTTQDSISKMAISVVSKLPSSPKHKSNVEHSKWQSATTSDKDPSDMSEILCRTSADGEKLQMSDNIALCTPGKQSKSIASQNSEPVVREKVFYNKKQLPKPAPPPPQQRDFARVSSETEQKSATRIPPIGMSHQKRSDSDGNSSLRVHHLNSRTPVSNLREKCMDKDILRTTVTLQQPVELNGEDELVFTLVEELSIGNILDNGRPSSIVSFNSDCSLQALASGSRPVSIISSINDEFDAYTCNVSTSNANIKLVAPPQEKEFASLGSCGSTITSWLSEVSVCTQESEGAQSEDVFFPQGAHSGPENSLYLESLRMFQSSPHKEPKNSLNDSGCSFSELDSDSATSSKLSLSKCPSSPEATKVPARSLPKLAKSNTIHLSGPHSLQESQVVQCSLSRKLKPTSSITQSSSISGSSSSSNWRREPPRQDCLPDNPWHRNDSSLETSLTSNSGSLSKLVRNGMSGIPARKAGTNSSSVPRMPKALGSNQSQRVVDGCEKSSNSRKIEYPSKMPQLRRGATTLGTVPVIHTSIDVKVAQDIGSSGGSLKFSSLGKNGRTSKQEETTSKPGSASPPPPPVRKSSLDQKNRILFPSSALKSAYDARNSLAPRATGSEDEIDVLCKSDSNSLRTSNLKSDHNLIKTSSSLKARGARGDTGQLYGSQTSLDRCDSFSSLGSRPALSRENSGASLNSKSNKSASRFGSPVATSSPTATSPPPCINPVTTVKSGLVKGSLNARPLPVNANKARTLSTSNSKALSSSTKCLAAPATRNSNLPPSGKTALPRAAVGGNGKSTRGTIMGTKQAMRAANSRVSELATTNPSGKHPRGSGDSDSGNDSGVNLNDDKPTPIPILPSPYSKITAPRRPQRYSSGHGSDNSSVLSGELPPAMGRTALFYHSGGSSGYESMIRDSEATGSASSAHDSMSESGMSSSGRTRISKPPKKRANGLQRRRLIPAPLPDTSSLGKAGTTGQWVDLPPMSGPLTEPFEIKVYEIDDVERLQRRRLEKTDEQTDQDVEKGLVYFNTKMKVLEKRQQQIRDLKNKNTTLKEELEDTKSRLMMDPSKWIGEFEVDQDLDQESQEYLEALEQVTAELEYCVNLCKSRVMMVTCFDIRVATDVQEGPREVEV